MVKIFTDSGHASSNSGAADKDRESGYNNGNKAKYYRLVTGTFTDQASQKAAIEAVSKKTGWIIYPYNKNGLRITTGIFTTAESANKAKSILEKEFGYTVYFKS
ncbi:hypothetical protein [Bacillus testis]|uniref:hypothetical protein n=1 Tax=Bacillus testis TaxID=1622072 RepID=UPI00067ECAA0|nr:hypothetical protein [Bacillus testis]